MGGRVTIEPGGCVFRGVGVPYHESALVVERDGRIVEEQFDEYSILMPPMNIPLLVSHRRDAPPAGVITRSESKADGLHVEGRLIGSDDEIEGWRRRLGANLMSSLSVGFTARGAQKWEPPARTGSPPRTIRRGVSICELSLVSWPAYEGARVASISSRTQASAASHRFMTEAVAYMQDTAAYLEARRQRR